jgi:hypothetical protein
LTLATPHRELSGRTATGATPDRDKTSYPRYGYGYHREWLKATPVELAIFQAGIVRLLRINVSAMESKLAEREGFEPPIPAKVCRFSRPVPSTARPPLRITTLLLQVPDFFRAAARELPGVPASCTQVGLPAP